MLFSTMRSLKIIPESVEVTVGPYAYSMEVVVNFATEQTQNYVDSSSTFQEDQKDDGMEDWVSGLFFSFIFFQFFFFFHPQESQLGGRLQVVKWESLWGAFSP